MSRIIVGLMRIDQMNVNEVDSFIKECLENDLNFFDLADIYGATHCEELVGEVIKNNPGLREKMIIQTKVGIGIRGESFGYNSSYEYIMSHVKGCLSRLNTSYLDILLIHRPDIFMDAEEVGRAVKELKEAGMIKEFGVSNFNSSEIEYLNTELDTKIRINQVQLGLGNTTMIDQTFFTNVPSNKCSKENDDLFFYMKKNKMVIECWSPFQYGFFEGSIFNKEKYPLLNEVLDKYAAKYNTTPCGIASAFLFKLDKNLMIVSGTTKYNHLKDIVDGEKIELTKEDWYRIYSETGHLIP